MMEHLPGPPVINTTLLSHFLFINSPSTITAWDQMKGEGKDFCKIAESELGVR